ncbi:MAG: class I adenylate-forming enzyme family protein [Hespellia sp.]|nr:class I adenylate-forming enzyme family protein [Hespellia sp.]
MVTWKEAWPKEVVEGMDYVDVGGKKIFTYKNMSQSLYAALQATTERKPEKLAIVNHNGERYTYREFLEMVDCLAGCLHETYHIGKGTHVGLMLFNGIEFCTAYLALNKVGAVVVSLPGKFQKPEVLSLAEKADITHVICEEKFCEWFVECKNILRIKSEDSKLGYGFQTLIKESAVQERLQMCGSFNDPAILMFTSGTTSRSKGVLLKNYNIMHSVEAYIRTLALTEDDISLVATPMYHITGMVCILAVFITLGGTLHILKKVDPDLILQSFIKNQITFYHASPTVFAILLSKRDDYPEVPAIKSFACGSGNMPKENIKKLYQWMPKAKFHTVFGMTETSGAGTIFPEGAAESKYIGASGVPMPNLEVKIIDGNAEEVDAGAIGEVCLRGSFILEEYYNIRTDSLSEDGWLKTGDLGYCNEAGYLFIVDRKKDMINRGGEKICTFDIENELYRIPGILEAAVVGIPNEKYMEVPGALVKVEKGAALSETQIQEELRQRIARYMIPEYILFVDEVPKTVNGKIDKRMIRKVFTDAK